MSLSICTGRRAARWDIGGETLREHPEVAHPNDECPVCRALDKAEEQSNRATEMEAERDALQNQIDEAALPADKETP